MPIGRSGPGVELVADRSRNAELVEEIVKRTESLANLFEWTADRRRGVGVGQLPQPIVDVGYHRVDDRLDSIGA